MAAITAFRSPAGDLYVVTVDNTTDAVLSYMQTGDGVWHGPTNISTNPNPYPFVAIEGIDGYGLVAMDSVGALWYIQQKDNVWNPSGFTPLYGAEWIGFSSFAVSEVKGFPLAIAATGAPPAQLIPGQLFSMCGSLSNMPVPVAVATNANNQGAIPTAYDVAIIGIDPEFGQPPWPEGDTPTAVLAALAAPPNVGPQVPQLLQFYTSVDGVNWDLVRNMPLPLDGGVGSLVLISGYPKGTLWAIATGVGSYGDGGNAFLYSDTSGQGTNWIPYAQSGGQLPISAGVVFTQAAASWGTDGNLQVVGLGQDGLPYLAWQDAASAQWSPYQNPVPGNANPMQLPVVDQTITFTNLVMGTGNQGFLQVAYLDSNRNVYVNFQDNYGNWRCYGPLP
jgi:hypothetical protein